MKKAMEMKTATIAVHEAKENALREQAERYAETVVMEEIELASAKGLFKKTLRKDGRIVFSHLRQYIEEFGYKVEGGAYEYTIYWQ